MYLPQPILPRLAAEFGLGPSQAGLLISALVMSIALMSLVVAPLSDRLGRRPLLVGCTALLALPTLGCALSRSFPLLLALRFAQGLLVPGVLSAAVAYLSEEFEARRVPLLIGGYIAATVTGGMLSRLLSGAVSEYASWRWAFALSGLLSLGVGTLLWRRLPGSSRFRPSANLGAAYRDMARHLRDGTLLLGGAVGFLLFFSFLGLYTYLPFHVAGPPYHFSPFATGLLYLSYGAGALASPLAGLLAQRTSRTRVLQLGLLGTLLASLATALPSTVGLVAALAALCFATFTVQSSATALIAGHARSGRAGANALYLFAYYLGGTLGGVLPGLAWARGAWPAVLALTGSSLLLAMLLSLRLRPARGA